MKTQRKELLYTGTVNQFLALLQHKWCTHIKVQFTVEQPIKAQMEGRGTVLLC